MHTTPIKTHEFHFCFHRQPARLISPRVIKIMVYFFVFARIKHEATSIFHNKKSWCCNNFAQCLNGGVAWQQQKDGKRTYFRAKNLMDFLLSFIKIQSHLSLWLKAWWVSASHCLYCEAGGIMGPWLVSPSFAGAVRRAKVPPPQSQNVLCHEKLKYLI